MYIFLMLLFGPISFVDGQTPFNAAYRQRAAANVTCGSPAETYYRIQDSKLLPQERTEKTCDANDRNKAHPPEYLVDGSMATFWQSTMRTITENLAILNDKAFIQIDLQQMFFASQIVITFGDQRRPGAIAISRSSNFGASFFPYHFLVSPPGTTECPSVFGMSHYSKGTGTEVDQVLCQDYALYNALDYNETVSVKLDGRIRGDGTSDSHSPRLLHHYTVREIEVLARCNCNGHADGYNCPQNETTNRRACRCQGNTCGENCEICCPLYNQKLWTKGSKAPWQVDSKASCEPCNCHNHSDACVYNQTVSDLRMSLDVHGNKSGGGICLDCKGHTRGTNCEICKEFYYRPKGRDKNREDACQACSCDVRGTKHKSGLTFLDCVTDDEELSSHPGKEPGDCYCKDNVVGRQCDKCKSEYFNLTRDNPVGCLDCRCHLPGTVNASNLCTPNETGQCPCKTHVELRDCSQCKHGYYNLTNGSSDGCLSCECDEGGSYPTNTCNKVSGQCQCRANVVGRQCKEVPDGYYFPDLHFIKATRDPYQPASSKLYTSLYIPKDANYSFFIKYIDEKAVPASDVLITARSHTTSVLFKLSCLLSTTGNISYCPLAEGNYFINITTFSAKRLESIAAVPEQFLNAGVLEETRRTAFRFQCDEVANDMREGTSSEETCLAGAFSLTVAFNNGTLPCACHPLGSLNHTICKKYGGSCTCKHGVEGRDCSRCKPGFYNLTEEGCKPCSCKGSNSVCHPFTGMCECPGNTTGRTCEPCQCNNNTNQCLRSGECLGCQFNTTGFNCDKCVNQTYGDASRQQCKGCDCDPVGSYSSSTCDIRTGQCSCRPYVVGRTCNQCKNNTYGFGSNGCTECNCSAFGSTSLQCNNSGHCSCVLQSTGAKCSQCKSGYYGLPKQACQACACNTTGTINGTICTNDTNGQCHCKPGVTGRACDRCMDYHHNFTDQGCSSCPQCVLKLKTINDDIVSELNANDEKVMKLNDLARLHEPLKDAEQKSDQIAVEASEFSVRLAKAQVEHERLVKVELPQANASYKEQLHKANTLENQASVTADNLTTHLERLTLEHNKTVETDGFVRSVNAIVQDISNAFSYNLQTGDQAIHESKDMIYHSLVRYYSNQEKLVDLGVKDANNLTAFVTGLAIRLFNQTSLARELNTKVQTSSSNLTRLLFEWNTTHAALISSVANITAHFAGIYDLMNQTKSLLSLESLALKAAKDLGVQSDETLNKTKRLLQEATSAYEQYKAMVTSVSGELKVSMLKYDVEGQWFVLKVLEGRNLSPRDLPSGTANPYVLVSLVPGNFGVQRSIIVNDTLNPSWPEYSQIYRFNIQHDQLRQSKLKLQVFDYDPEDEDDFMGETTIDLSALGDQTSTDWYSLRSEDISQIESGNFKTTSGLVDVSNLLLIQLNKVKPVLGAVEVKLIQAHQNAQQLKSLAEQLELEFNKSRPYGAAAVEAVQRYVEIEKIVNSSLEILSRAQENVISIASELNRVPLQELSTKASNELQSMMAFYNATEQRNLTVNDTAYVDHAISAANVTLHQAVQQWHEAYYSYSRLVEVEGKLTLTAAHDGPSAAISVSYAQERTNEINESITSLSRHISDLELQVASVFNKIEFVKNSSERDSSAIQNAFSKINTASSKLNNVSSNVLEALGQKQEIQEQQQYCDTKLSALEEKLHVLKNRMSNVDLALNFTGEGGTEYTLSNRTLEFPTKNELLLTFKTSFSEGLLLNLLGEKVNSQQTGLVAYLSDGKLNIEYNTGQESITLINPVLVSTTQWIDLYFTRIGSSSVLTVTSPNQSETVTHNENSGSDNATLHFTNKTTIFLGGTTAAPQYKTAQNLDRILKNFTGIIDSLSFDQVIYSLWKTTKLPIKALYGLPRYPNLFYPNNGQAASFFHKGYVQQQTAEFKTQSGYSLIEFDFRTFRGNGTVFAVTSENQATIIIVIFILDGQMNLMVYFEDNMTSVSSKSSSYNDGKWYHVKAFITNTQTSLAVSHNGTTDNSSMDVPSSTLPPSQYVYFGSLPTNSNATLPVKESFVGDLKNVKLNRNGTNTLELRLFKSSKGVSTYRIYRKVEPEAVRFYGYRKDSRSCSYIAMDPKQSQTNSLSFSFKTSKNSGVLLYSALKVGGRSLYLYVALFHGRLRLLTHDSTTSQSEPFVISNMKFNDNVWRNIKLNSTESGYSLHINGDLVSTSWFGTSRQHPINLSNPLYIGGVPNEKEISLKVPVTWCFEGAMKNFKVNTITMDLLSEESMGVSGAGVSLAAAPPPPPTPAPPTCAATAGPLTYSTNSEQVGFSAGFGSNTNQQSYLVFNHTFSGIGLSFTLELHPLSSNGLVLYIADNQTHPERFMSMEVVDGRIKCQVNFGPGHIKMKSSIDYVKTNEWFQIHLVRILDFGFFLVSKTNEYRNDQFNGVVPPDLKLTGPLYIGGVPSHVMLHPLVTQRNGFSGCLRALTFGSNELSSAHVFDLKNADLSYKMTACLSNAQPGMGFNGSSWVDFGKTRASPNNFNLQLEFRTSSRDGVLVYLVNDTKGPGQHVFLKLEQASGQIVLSHRHQSGSLHQVTWSASSSYLLCNMTWHTLSLTSASGSFNLTVDDKPPVSLPVSSDTTIHGQLYVGGVPGRLSTPEPSAFKGFLGCLRNLKLDNKVLDFGRAVDAKDTTNGCPSNTQVLPAR